MAQVVFAQMVDDEYGRRRWYSPQGQDITLLVQSGNVIPATPDGSGGGTVNLPNGMKGVVDRSGNIVQVMQGPNDNGSIWQDVKNTVSEYGKSAMEFAPYAAAFVGGINGLQGLGYLPAGDAAGGLSVSTTPTYTGQGLQYGGPTGGVNGGLVVPSGTEFGGGFGGLSNVGATTYPISASGAASTVGAGSLLPAFGAAGLAALGGAAGSAGATAAGAAGTAGASSILARLLSGDKMNLDDILRAGGALGGAALGAYGANQMSDAYKSAADAQRQAEMERFNTLVGLDRERYQTAMQREDAAIAKRDAMIAEAKAIGAPSRDRYEASYAPGFTMQNDPGYMDAINQTGKATMRAMSVNGNPADSPNAWSQTLEDLFSKTAYPALQNYRNNNATTGGYASFNQAAGTIPGIGSNVPTGSTAGSGVGTQAGSQANLASIQSGSGVYNALGGALADLTTPTRSIEDILKAMGGGNNVFAYGR